MPRGRKTVPDNKKQLKKQADKLVSEGVKLLESIEENDITQKAPVYLSAESKFLKALEVIPLHADAMYNLAWTKLERYSDEVDSNKNPLPSEFEMALGILNDVISNDTSQRGETTGLAHRAIAVSVLKHFELYVNDDSPLDMYDALVARSQHHISRAATILANAPELDSYIFEYCELLHPLWIARLSKCSTFESCHSLLAYIAGQLEAALQTQTSSGIDMDVYMLYGEFLTDYVEHITSHWAPGADHVPTDAMFPVLHQLEMVSDAISALSLSDIENSSSIVTDDESGISPEDSMLMSGDLLSGAVNIHRYFLLSSTSPQSVTDFSRICVKLLSLRELARCKLPSFVTSTALAYDVMQLGNLLSADAINTSVLETFKEAVQSVSQSLFSGDMGRVWENEFSDTDIRLWLYTVSRRLYESALSALPCSMNGEELVSHSCADKEDSADHMSAAFYNLACVCWKLGDEFACKDNLMQYLKIERYIIQSKHSGYPEEMIKLWEDLIFKLKEDSDLDGINKCEWFLSSVEFTTNDTCR